MKKYSQNNIFDEKAHVNGVFGLEFEERKKIPIKSEMKQPTHPRLEQRRETNYNRYIEDSTFNWTSKNTFSLQDEVEKKIQNFEKQSNVSEDTVTSSIEHLFSSKR